MAKQSFGEYLKEDLGVFLKRIRKEAGFNLSQLSRASNISQPYLTQIESGERIPSPEVLKRLADGLCYVTNEYYSYGTLLEKAGYEELAKGQMLLELQRRGLAEENQPSKISTPKENLKGGDGMIRYEQITLRQAAEMVFGGRTDSLFVEISSGLINIERTEIHALNIGRYRWFIRIEQNESK